MNEKRLLELIQQESQLSERIADLRTKNAIQLRKEQTRRQILLGACLLKKTNGDYTRWLKDLDKFLTAKADRILFNLPI